MPARRMGVLGVVALGAVVAAMCGCGPPDAGDFSRVDFEPAETRTGPAGEDFNSTAFRIVRVLRQPKQLSAFGYASLYDDTREVGRMDEGQKKLPPAKQGERILFTWRYRGKAPTSATARIELQRQHETGPAVIEEAYASLKPGAYRIAYNNRGADYREHGAVIRWRFQIIAGDTVVAQKQSSLWSAMAGAQPATQ